MSHHLFPLEGFTAPARNSRLDFAARLRPSSLAQARLDDGLPAAGLSFLGLPPLPAVPLPYKDNSAPAPVIAESGALAPAPSKNDYMTGKGLVSSVADTYIQVGFPPWLTSYTH